MEVYIWFKKRASIPLAPCTLAAFVFVYSVFEANIPTAELGVISKETACWDIERK